MDDLSTYVFYYSLLPNAAEIFLLDTKGGGEGSSIVLFYCFNTLWYSCTGPTCVSCPVHLYVKSLGLQPILDGKGPSVQIRWDL